jgi:hypothetical protein
MITAALCSVLVTGVLGQVKMKVISPASFSGTMVMTATLAKDGTLTQKADVNLMQDGVTMTLKQTAVFAKDGRPVSKSLETKVGEGPIQKIGVTFGKTKALLVVVNDGVTRKGERLIPEESILATPDFWLIRDKPKAGTKITYHRFDMARQDWSKTVAVYHGLVKVEIGGKQSNAHYTQIGDTKAYSDKNGDPLRLEQQGLVFERV